jgi:predicted TIM-barrel fold metal-dependent hydrolase
VNPRREFLVQLAAATAGAVLWPADGRAAQTARGATTAAAVGRPRRIDIHHHYQSPGWAKVLGSTAAGARDAFEGWTPDKAIADMDKAGVDLAMTSAATYLAHQADLIKEGVPLRAGDTPRRYAREANEYGAKLVSDYKGRFGLFAVLPFPDNDSSLQEIEYALGPLKADGFALATNYGKYLGDPAFAPVLEELNHRRAIVYTHPATADCCLNVMPRVPSATLEYGNDTARAIMSLLVNNAGTKYPEIRWVFSHAGGTLPYLISRIVGRQLTVDANGMVSVPPGETSRDSGAERLVQLRRWYFDTAQTANAATMAALRKVVPVSQIVFGTDYPYRTMADHVQGLRDSRVFTAEELVAIDRENTLRLLPKYRAS